MAHVEGYYSTNTPAFKNRNPGNIEFASGVMHVYPNAQTGFNALVTDIAANAGKPLNVFIAKYAPPNENNTSLYLQVVSTLTGISPEEPI
jgi:hypothetical protein